MALPEIKLFIREIDPRAEKLFTRQFLEREMKRHDIKAVKMSHFLWTLRKGQPMIFDPEERTIWIAIDAPWEEVRQRLNRENAAGLDLSSEDEAAGFVFFHEAAHTDPLKSEYECDRYAAERIRQWRERR
jgi:hypothetical protein